MKRVLRGSLAGALLGLGLFALEGARVMQTGAIGINLDDTAGPFAALFAAVRPALPGLLARIAAMYLLGGATLGGAAAVLAGMLLSDAAGKAKWVAAWLLEGAVVAALLAAVRANAERIVTTAASAAGRQEDRKVRMWAGRLARVTPRACANCVLAFGP